MSLVRLQMQFQESVGKVGDTVRACMGCPSIEESLQYIVEIHITSWHVQLALGTVSNRQPLACGHPLPYLQ